MNIQNKLIDKLKPAKYNPRQITTKQYKDLKDSITKFGLVDPIIVNKDLTVIGGHQRLKVCKELNFTEVKCVVVDLSKQEERELNIRLNKNTGAFDMDILANEFDFDNLVDWGFRHVDLGLNIDKIDANEEWEGMPEFDNEDLTPHKQLIISFNNDDDIQEFAKLIDQKITEKTKSLWFPKVENTKQFDKLYVSEKDGVKHILFWSEFDKNIDTDYDTWKNRKLTLSPIHKLAMASHLKLNNSVVLYSYQQFEEGQIDNRIELKDPSEILSSEQAYKSLIAGHSIAHISDCVRLKSAASCNGIVLDMDAVLLKELPKEDGWFASMPAKLTGGFAPKWGESHPPLSVWDNSWDGKALGAFPIKVSETMEQHIMMLSDKIINSLKSKPKTDSNAWNYVIWTIKDIMKIDNRLKVYPPSAFCPIPSWLGKGKCYSIESPTRLDGKTELFGFKLPTIDTILNESYIVQHFVESAFNKSPKLTNDFWNNLNSDCLLAKEAEHILGKEWRKTLAE